MVITAADATSARSPAEDDADGPSTCRRVPLEGVELRWVSSGAWVGESLILADPATSRLVEIGPRAEPRSHRALGQGPLEYLRPAQIEPLPEGYLLQDGNSHLLQLNRDLRPQQAMELGAASSRDGKRVGGLFNWTLDESGELFAYASIQRADDEWWAGMVRLGVDPVEERVRIEPLLRVPTESRESVFYRMIYQYVATLGERGFLLSMGERPAIVLLGAEPRRLDAFPADLRRRTELPPIEGPQSVPVLLAAVEAASLPVGLYGWQDRLYLLGRRPAESTGTEWTLTVIDPERDRIERTLRLPTGASHLVVVPGDTQWALVEKGPARALSDQEVRSALLLPASWLSATDSPLIAERAADGIECSKEPTDSR